MKITWIIIALVSGAFLPIQAGLNSRMGKAIESPVHASLISFIVGAVTVLLYSILTKQQVYWSGFRNAPAYVLLAGVMGAFYVTAIILTFPKIGPAMTFGIVVAGQMTMSVLLDHFNILVAQQHTVTVWKLLGVVLIITGVVIIRKF
ncbi:DMT family transporter [Ferruginibacter profundus]